MSKNPSAKRYAMALFQLGLENGTSESMEEDLKMLGEAMLVAQFATFLAMPKIGLPQKMALINGSMPDLDPVVQNLVGLLIARGTAEVLPTVKEEYAKLLDQQHGREKGYVVTAVPLKQGQKKLLAQYLGELTGKEIDLSTSVNTEIVGGLVARVGDRIIDGSIKTKLQDLKKSLAQSS